MELTQEFLIETLFSYCKRPIHKKYQNSFNSECPVCKEGKSAGRTRRLFYFPNKEYFYCHNCVKSWRPIDWIKEVTGWSFPEIVKKNNEKKNHACTKNNNLFAINTQKISPAVVLPDLPENSIDITDQAQLDFYKSNKYVKTALEYCIERRLFTAINTCKRFYVSLDDKVHKRRLVLPFFNEQKQIVCYQTRALTQHQFPKYLTKFGEKTVFNIDNIDVSVPYVFIFEGPIDSMFVKNGVAIASVAPTERQIQQLNTLIGYEQIYVFDNDKNNKQVARKIEKYIKEGKRIFIWPKEFLAFKDFNEICCKLKINEISWKFVVKHSAINQEAMIKQKLKLALTTNPS